MWQSTRYRLTSWAHFSSISACTHSSPGVRAALSEHPHDEVWTLTTACSRRRCAPPLMLGVRQPTTMSAPFEFENTKPDISNDDLVLDLQRVAAALGVQTVPARTYRQHGRFSATVFQTRFGTWNKALAAAGLGISSRYRLADKELFDNLRRVWIALGRQPRKGEMAPPASTITHQPLIRHFVGVGSLPMRAFVAASGGSDDLSSRAEEPLFRPGSRAPSLRLRFLVMRRDHFRCTACGRSPATTSGVILHLNHIVPFSQGGATDSANLRTLCGDCNLGKGDLNPER